MITKNFIKNCIDNHTEKSRFIILKLQIPFGYYDFYGCIL